MPSASPPSDVIVHRDLPYVTQPHPRHHLDLYLPSGAGPWPVIIWVHGGAFRLGSKEDGVPVAYLAEGYAIAAINYRLSQHALWPAQLVDCKAAVRWLRAHASEYGLDPEHFAAWGPSAGGHLAAMLGLTARRVEFEQGEHLEMPSSVCAVVDYYGPTDFLQMDAHRLPEGMVHDAPDSPESQLVGGPIQEHPERVASANPVTYVTPDAPPFLIVHGDRDPLVPYHQSVLLYNALRAVGASVEFYTVVGGGHGGFTDPAVDELTRAFLARTIGVGGRRRT